MSEGQTCSILFFPPGEHYRAFVCGRPAKFLVYSSRGEWKPSCGIHARRYSDEKKSRL